MTRYLFALVFSLFCLFNNSFGQQSPFIPGVVRVLAIDPLSVPFEGEKGDSSLSQLLNELDVVHTNY